MAEPALIVGSLTSPYVRKVLVVCELKGLAYRVDPLIPFYGNDRFDELSPLRRVPVFRDQGVSLADSSVICQYLEDRYPEPRLYPADPADAAQARWLEEYADTRLGKVFIWGLFNEAVVAPAIWGKTRDIEAINRVLNEDVPEVMRYLEGELPADGFLFGAEPSIADIALAAFFRNARWARFEPDGRLWPRTAGLVRRVLGLPAMLRLAPYEDILVRTPPEKQREVLAAAGFPVADFGVTGETPRRGPTIA
jgi:glutathione S-transferase